GELLSRQTDASFQSPFSGGMPSSQIDDSPPTMVLDQARVTNPIGWSNPAQPPARWEQQQPQVAYPYNIKAPVSQTLGIVSLCLGLGSITIGLCCYVGLLLGPAAMITGFIALAQNKSDPTKYGGRGLAIGGIAAGAAYVVFLVIFWLIYGLVLIGGNI
ncbi:MAG: DUF4190 domain-containing protein, partial [Pyrinomonadaceae bacterium]